MSGPRNAKTEPIENFYTLGGELGRGSFSTVFKAQRKADSANFACKVIQKEKLGPKKMEMVDIEVSILRTVDHPDIIKLVEIYENNDSVYLVMELITGGELFDKIVELQSYSEEIASTLIQQMLSAIEHLHSNNIVHRDLKPENLLLSSSEPDARVKLGDFGLSSFILPGEKLLKAVGTPGYIAPEVIQTLDEDLDGYGKEVDMWGIGVITYIILCGFPPFYAEDDDDAFDQIISGKFDFPDPYWSKISERAKDFIRKLLVVDAKKRFTAKEALGHPWIKDRNADVHLEAALEQLKKFNAKKRWKKGINTVIAAGRFQWTAQRVLKNNQKKSGKQ